MTSVPDTKIIMILSKIELSKQYGFSLSLKTIQNLLCPF